MLPACPELHSLESAPPRAFRFRRRHPTPSRLPGRTSLSASDSRLSTRQGARVFNQPLSFDTFKVTTMNSMFAVRSARALAPSLESGPPRACHLRRRHPTPPRLPRRTPLLESHAHLLTRQVATAFNQPLSFDTSKVTNMERMFQVRSARALAPTALSRALPVHATCVAGTERPHASRVGPLPACGMPAFRLGSPHSSSTSRSASTRPRSRPCTRCSTCAPRVPWPP